MICPSNRPGKTLRIVFVASESHRSSYAVDFNRSGAFTDYRMKESLRYYGISKLLLRPKQDGRKVGMHGWSTFLPTCTTG